MSPQRSRGKYLKAVPPDLDHLIKVVNGLPPENSLTLRFMHPESLRAQVEAEVGMRPPASGLTFDVMLSSAALERTRHLATELQSYVERGAWRDSATNITLNPFERYSQVWNAYQALHALAKLRTQAVDHQGLFRFGQAPISGTIYVDQDGIVRETKSLLSNALAKESVEAARIRECPICRRIFWAGRSDAEQCGNSKCKSALSSRLKRNPELRDLYNMARRRKRQINRRRKTKRAKTARER